MVWSSEKPIGQCEGIDVYQSLVSRVGRVQSVPRVDGIAVKSRDTLTKTSFVLNLSLVIPITEH